MSLRSLRAEPTEDEAKRFLERLAYRYLNRVLDHVVKLYNITQEDAEILRDRLVNMNLIDVIVEDANNTDQEK